MCSGSRAEQGATSIKRHNTASVFPGTFPQTKGTIVGNNKSYRWEHLIGPFLMPTLLGPRPPFPPSPDSNTSLPPPPTVTLDARGGGGGQATQGGSRFHNPIQPRPVCSNRWFDR